VPYEILCKRLCERNTKGGLMGRHCKGISRKEATIGHLQYCVEPCQVSKEPMPKMWHELT
jgi:hypothetical protein